MINTAFLRFVFLLLMATNVAGCTGYGTAEPILSAVPKTPAPSLSPTPTSVETPVAITLENVRALLKMDFTPERMKQTFGDDYERQTSSLYKGTQWVDTERWEYGDPLSGSKLLLEWSEEGQLLYAILYGKDASGRTTTYVPPMGALTASGSELNPYAALVAVDAEKAVRVAVPTLGYDMIEGSSPRASYLARPERPLRVISMNATFAEVDDDGVRSWLPAWYLTAEAAQEKRIEPLLLKAFNDTQALWAPAEGAEAAASVHAGETLYALHQFGDWYGVAVPPSAGRRGIELAWIPMKDAQPSQEWMELYAGAGASADTIATVIRSELMIGVSRERIERIFGKPAYEESSNNVEMPGKLRTLVVSRYESDSSQLAITWEDGALRGYSFLDRADTMDFGIPPYYESDYPIVLRATSEPAYKPHFASSAPLAFEWRTRTELPYNFLVGTTGSILIVAGEDGGFSGMHNSSHLYGIDRKSGAIVWKHDFRYERHLYTISEDGRLIAFIDKIESKVEGSAYDLFVLDTATGKKLWTQHIQVKGAIEVGPFVSSGSIAALSYTTTEGDKNTTHVEARKMSNGSLVWSRTFEGAGELLPQHPEKPVFVLQTGTQLVIDGKLTALDPKSGRARWELPERLGIGEDRYSFMEDTRFSISKSPGYWIRGVDDLALVDPATGKILLTLPPLIDNVVHYESIDGRYMLLQQTNDGDRLYESKDVTSSLIDMRSGATLWKVEGKADRGVIGGDVLYFKLDGKPRAVKLGDGAPIWETDIVAHGKLTVCANRLLVEGIPDVYALDASTGEVLHRYRDIRIEYYDITPNKQMYGTITVLDGRLYVGSSNGFFGSVGFVES